MSARSMPRYAADHLVRCVNCNLVYASTLPSPDELTEHYSSYPASDALSELTSRRFAKLLDGFERFRQTGRLMDVGCGDGHFLSAARERGWTTLGSEYGEDPRRRAHERGLDVRPAPFAPSPDEVGSFDIVAAIEVIEHVAEPRSEIERMTTLLRSGGCVYLTTPNFDSVSRRVTGPRWRAIEYPEHLQLFTPRTLDQLLADAGLAKLELVTTGLSPSDIRAGLRPRPVVETAPPAARDDEIRAHVASSPGLQRAVAVANATLTRLGAGDTIKALYQLP